MDKRSSILGGYILIFSLAIFAVILGVVAGRWSDTNSVGGREVAKKENRCAGCQKKMEVREVVLDEKGLRIYGRDKHSGQENGVLICRQSPVCTQVDLSMRIAKLTYVYEDCCRVRLQFGREAWNVFMENLRQDGKNIGSCHLSDGNCFVYIYYPKK